MSGLRVGYPDLTHTAKQIADFIGPCDIFCEPFAGLARVSQYIKANKIYLSDLSEYSVDFCRKTFPFAVVKKSDFIETIRELDSDRTTFLIDPPWNRKDYADNPKTFCDRGVGVYYKQLLDLTKTMRGRWFVAGRASGGSRSCVSVYFKEHKSIIFQSKKTINGHNIKTKIYYK